MGEARIPIKAAEKIAKKYGQSHVVIMTYDDETGLTHVVTYGRSIKDCHEAAQGGNFLKKTLGWPASLCQDVPARVRKAKGA